MSYCELSFILLFGIMTFVFAYRQGYKEGYGEGLYFSLETFLETKKNLFEEEGDDDGN